MLHFRLKPWLKCQRCPLGSRATKHVLGRGELPSTVLFIGEAPGKSEDVIGKAFVGRSGKLLEEIIRKVGSGFTYAFTNVVACRPCDSSSGPNRLPQPVEIQACFRRLSDTIELSGAKAIVLVGKVAQQYAGSYASGRVVGGWNGIINIPHPSYILRQGGNQSQVFRKTVRYLRERLSDLGIVKNESCKEIRVVNRLSKPRITVINRL